MHLQESGCHRKSKLLDFVGRPFAKQAELDTMQGCCFPSQWPYSSGQERTECQQP